MGCPGTAATSRSLGTLSNGRARPRRTTSSTRPRRCGPRPALPDARFIALLREPSARALSHYSHNRANGVEPLSVDDTLAAERDRLDADRDGSAHRLYSYVARGLYAEQVSRWRDAVGDRLLVLLSDDLFHDPRQTFDRVEAFVGLDQWEPTDFQVHSPHRMIDAPPISASLRRRLQERFAAPNRALAEVLGRDLSEWSDRRASPDSSLTPQPQTTPRRASWP